MRNRSGVVLLLALLCIVALELAAAGLHFAALQELRAARAGTRSLQLRLSAQAAAVTAVAAWPAEQALVTPIGGLLPIPAAAGREQLYSIDFGASAERLGDELFLVRGEAASPLRERARIGCLVVAPDPARGLSAAAVRTSAGLSLAALAALAAGGPACGLQVAPPALQLPDPDLLSLALDASLAGSIEIQPELTGAHVAELIPFPLDRLLSAALALPASQVRPGPVIDGGRCVTGLLTNWGEPDPLAPDDPCTFWLPVLTRTGDLRLDGGRGQGVLYVSGDLVLAGGASFAGLVLVDGRVSLEDGASVRGAVIAAGSVSLSNASITGDRCAVSAALAAVPALAGPFVPRGRRWVPLF